MPSHRKKWYSWENIAAAHLEELWYHILAKNYTIANWEIDIIAESWEERMFIEVKVVAPDTELAWYITSGKIQAMQRTATAYNLANPTDKNLRLDAIFVSNGSILEHFEYISFYQ